MKYKLPDLPYSYDAFEPYIDRLTMHVHHTKHHQNYIDKLNQALEGYPDLQKMSLPDLLASIHYIPESIRSTVINHGGGHANHSLFWRMLSPVSEGRPTGTLIDDIKKTFGSFEEFQNKFSQLAVTVFGSGWTWLVMDSKGLEIVAMPNQDSPWMYGKQPILGIDVWEHAYYLAYQNRRADYIQSWWKIIDWSYVQELYDGVAQLQKDN